VKKFEAGVGRIRGWSRTDGDTRYSIRVHLPAAEFARQAKEPKDKLFSKDTGFGPELTNLRVIEERKSIPEGNEPMVGRTVLAERPNRNRVLDYLLPIDVASIFLFVERPGLTLDDDTARLFFESLRPVN
jgi:hypothetical protein